MDDISSRLDILYPVGKAMQSLNTLKKIFQKPKLIQSDGKENTPGTSGCVGAEIYSTPVKKKASCESNLNESRFILKEEGADVEKDEDHKEQERATLFPIRAQSNDQKFLITYKEFMRSESMFLTNVRILKEYLDKFHEQADDFPVLRFFSSIVASLIELSSSLISDMTEDMPIHSALNRVLPFMKLYVLYSAQYGSCYNDLENIMRTDKNLRNKIVEIENDFGDSTKTLTSLLTLPLQRVMRYIVILEDFSAVAEEALKEDFKKLADALRETVRCADNVVNQRQESEQLWKLQCLVDEQVDVFIPGRRLLYQGKMKEVKCIGKDRYETIGHRGMFIFNDAVLITQPVIIFPRCEISEHRCLHLFAVIGCQCFSVTNKLVVDCDGSKVVFEFESADELEKCRNVFTQAVLDAIRASSSLKRNPSLVIRHRVSLNPLNADSSAIVEHGQNPGSSTETHLEQPKMAIIHEEDEEEGFDEEDRASKNVRGNAEIVSGEVTFKPNVSQILSQLQSIPDYEQDDIPTPSRKRQFWWMSEPDQTSVLSKRSEAKRARTTFSNVKTRVVNAATSSSIKERLTKCSIM